MLGTGRAEISPSKQLPFQCYVRGPKPCEATYHSQGRAARLSACRRWYWGIYGGGPRAHPHPACPYHMLLLTLIWACSWHKGHSALPPECLRETLRSDGHLSSEGDNWGPSLRTNITDDALVYTGNVVARIQVAVVCCNAVDSTTHHDE